MKQKLTIIIPVYNEEKFIEEIYTRVLDVNLHPDISKEVIIIDDGSKDRTKEIIKSVADERTIIIEQKRNNIAHIFFISTKYRVYCKHLIDSNNNFVCVELPNKQWDLVQLIEGIYDLSITVLTPVLIEK